MICPLFVFNGAKPSTIGFHSYERHDHAYTPRTNGAKHSNIGFQPYERDPRSRRHPICSNGAKPSAIGFSTLCDNMTSMPEPGTGDICKKTKIKMLDKINFIILHQN